MVSESDINKLNQAKAAQLKPAQQALAVLKQNAKEIIKKRLKKKGNRLGELSRAVDLSKDVVLQILDEIKVETGLSIDIAHGEVHIDHQSSLKSPIPIKLKKLYKKRIRVGVASDPHLCGISQQPTLLHTAFTDFDDMETDFNVCCGDLSDGSPKMHRGFEYEIFINKYDDQVNYIVDTFPKSKRGTACHILRGNHDESWIKAGAGDLVYRVCQEREDLNYISPEKPFITDKKDDIMLEVFHPSGGLPYAKSYRGQKILESVVSKALTAYRKSRVMEWLPHVCLIGHLHTFDYFIDGGTHVILTPCFQKQTNYLRSKNLTPMIGYLILDFLLDDNGTVTGCDIKVRDLSTYIKDKDY